MIKTATHGSPSNPPTLRERIAALRYVPQLIKLVWDTHRGFMTAILALRLLLAINPVASLWIGKLIVDAVVSAIRNPSAGYGRLWELLALEAAIVLSNEAL